MSSVVSGLETIWKTLTNLPSLIGEALRSFFTNVIDSITSLPNRFKTFFDSIVDSLINVWNAITSLPELILEGIKSIFIPDDSYIQESFNGFLQELKLKFSIDTSTFESLFSSEEPVTDTSVDYHINGIGTLNLKVFDAKYLVQGVMFFRPYLRGFLVLLMFLFHMKQIQGFFGYNAGVVDGRNEHIQNSLKEQR